MVSDLKMQHYDRDAIRLMRGQHIVGMLLRLANGRWSICGKDEKSLTKRTFLQAGMARDFAVSERLIP